MAAVAVPTFQIRMARVPCLYVRILFHAKNIPVLRSSPRVAVVAEPPSLLATARLRLSSRLLPTAVCLVTLTVPCQPLSLRHTLLVVEKRSLSSVRSEFAASPLVRTRPTLKLSSI